jgi:thymidine phosphorylase
MSKKLAEGLDGLVLDVKTGEGAFLQDLDSSLALARTMVTLGEKRGVRTSALVTAMDAPLGRAIGNGLETREALECLGGEGPEDLVELCLSLIGEMLFRGGVASTPDSGAGRASKALEEGVGLERMRKLVELQGGDPGVVDDPSLMPLAPEVATLEAIGGGFVTRVSPLSLGYGVVELGGGWRRMKDPVDLRVGFILHARPGDRLEKGDPIGEVHAADASGLLVGLATLARAVEIGEEAPPPSRPLVIERVVDSPYG